MKRRISFLLALIMVLTIIPFSSFAQNYDKQLEEAIVRSKKIFNIGSEYDKFNYSINSDGEDTEFNLNWSDSKGKLGDICVSIAIDGTVLSYDKWKAKIDEEPKVANISKEEGLDIAKKLHKKVSPKFADNIKYIDISEPLNIHFDQYNYYFVRTENGIPYYANNINISVNASTGEITNYYTYWETDLIFSDEKSMISLEKSQDLYKEKIGLDLLYKSNYKHRLDYADKQQETYLVYAPMDINLGIDAKTGEVIILNDYFTIYNRAGDMNCTKEDSAELSPEEMQAVKDVSGIISQKGAEKVAREILKIDSEYKLEYANIYKNWRNNDYNWEVSFEKKLNDDEYCYASASIDAKTKELVSFYKYSDLIDPNAKPKYNEEQALNIAKEYIKKANPDKFELVELKESPVDFEPFGEEESFSFEFVRKLDKAYVESDGITISVDAISGEITGYRVNWSKCEFAPQTKLMSVGKAYDILFNDIGMELKYVNPYHRYGKSTDEKKEAVLAYGLKTEKPAHINANTGTILDYTGEPYKEKTIISYNDIDDSYAKDKINILAQYGIALPEEKFKPKEKINQKDFLSLLVKAMDSYFDLENPRNDLYNFVINRGILKEDEKSPEKIVNKEEGIKYIIRALGYDKIADLNEIYKDLFKDTKDIDPKLKGYVSIAYGLGIVQGTDGKLNPKVELKREDAANIIYNYLFGGK